MLISLMINLINTSGPHGDDNVYVFDEIQPVGPLEISIRTGKKPKAMTLQPEGEVLDYTYSKGEVRLMLPHLRIHSIIEVG